jgi:iron(III) transport system permease protein
MTTGSSRRLAGHRFPLYVLLALVLATIGILIVLPLGSILSVSVLVGDGATRHLGWDNFIKVGGQAPYWLALLNTITISLGAAALASLIGVALAWTVTRTNAPFAALLERLAVLPIFIPPFVGAFAWLLVAAPKTGIANVVARATGLGEPFGIYSRLGIIWVMGIYLAPYVVMIVASALRSMDPSLEEAGHVSGLSRWRVVTKITLPVVAPAILSGAVLTFVVAIGLFGTPVLLGWPKQIMLLTSLVYLESQAVPPAYGVMAVLALYLTVLSGLIVLLQRRLLRGRQFITVTGKGFRPRLIRLGASRFVLSALIMLYLCLTVVMPLLVIFAAASVNYTWSNHFTGENVSFLWTSGDVRETMKNSLIIAITAASIATVLGFSIAWLVHRTKLPGRNLLEYVVIAPLSIPSIAFGIGVASLWLRLPWDVYDTIWLIVIGFVGRFSGYAVRTISGSLVQVHPELEESARVSGYGPMRTLWQITLPLIKPSIFSAWILLYSVFLTELSMVLMLYNPDTRTFSILTFDFWYAGYFSRVAALSLLQLAVGVAVMLLVGRLSGRGRATDGEVVI